MTEVAEALLDADLADIEEYYADTLAEYQTWSREGYLHFGYWKRNLWPWDRRGMLRAMNDLVFQHLGLAELDSGTIGDLGCGFGAVSSAGCQAFPRLHWFACTISSIQVQWALRQGLPTSVSLVRADYHQIPLPDACLSGAFFLESLCHSRHRFQAVAEAARLLQIGKRLVVVEGFWKRDPREAPPYLRRLEQRVCRGWALAKFATLSELDATATAAGLAPCDSLDLSWRIAPTVLHGPLLAAFHGLRLWLQRGRERQWNHLASCLGGCLLGLHRKYFGYYLRSYVKMDAKSSFGSMARTLNCSSGKTGRSASAAEHALQGAGSSFRPLGD